MLEYSRAFAVHVPRKAMQPAIVLTNLLPSAVIASKKVRSICYSGQRLRTYMSSGHLQSECTNKKVFDFLANVPTMSEDDAWSNVVRTAKEAADTRDLDDFREVCRPFRLCLFLPRNVRI